MTKNNALRLGSVMLVLALLTTCALWGTFAKYTTSVESNDSARVALWGVDESDTAQVDLFAQAYNTTPNTGGTAENSTVYATENVIAPGTSNTKDITIVFGAKAPEVKYKFTVDVDTDTSVTTELDKLAGFKWTLVAPGVANGSYSKFEDLVSALEGLGSADTAINPGSYPTNFAAGDNVIKVGWSWDFTDADGTDSDNDGVVDQDAADTAEGNLDTLENVVLNITVKAEQVNS